MKNLLIFLSVIAFFITACDKKEILPGKREAISGITIKEVEKSSKTGSLEKILPSSAQKISFYVDKGGNKQHDSSNSSMNLNDPKVLWKTSIGSSPIYSEIIAFGDNIYAVDARGVLVCIAQKDGKKLWKKQIAKQPDDSVFSGGLTANNGVIYLSTNIGKVFAIDSKTQKELWIKNLQYPLRGAPLYIAGKIIVTSIENQTFALNASNGKVIWTKISNKEQTVLSNYSTPAVFDNDVICAYSSGEISSLKIQDGSENWEDVIFSSYSYESGSNISHIAVSPIVHNGTVLAVTAESKMILLDVKSGIRIWEQDIGTINLPVVNNGWVFVLSNEGKIICLSLKNGSIKWISYINDLHKSSNNLNWYGPMMINGDISVFSSEGDILNIDISTGNLKKHNILKNVKFAMAPAIINGKMFVVTSRAEICAVE